MASESKDGWDKAVIIGGILGGVLVPLAIFLTGLFISMADKANTEKLANTQRENTEQLAKTQKANAELAAQTANLTNLIEHLSSQNPTQRKIAVEVAGYMAKQNQLPVELTPTLTRIATEDESSETAQAATQAVVSAAKANSTTEEIVKSGFKGLSPRVYFHVPTSDKATNAKTIGASLEKALPQLKLIVPGVEVVAGPNTNELRYFQESDKDEALAIQSALKKLGVDANLIDLSQRYKNATGIRPRHYELWYGKGS